jgi:SNF2 family DNA or RNA helicase
MMMMISLDLSWNYASESQAYDRVHRLGQEKDVFVKRLVVRNTIEERCVVLSSSSEHQFIIFLYSLTP